MIPAFISRMLAGEAVTIDGDGEQTRDFIHVDEVARANLLAAEDEGAIEGAFNIGSGESHSINDLHAFMRNLIPQSKPPQFGPARAGDIRSSEADTRLAQRALGFRAAIDLLAGLRGTVEWFESNHFESL